MKAARRGTTTSDQLQTMARVGHLTNVSRHYVTPAGDTLPLTRVLRVHAE